MSAVLRGLGTAVPAHAVTNDELAQQLDTNDEWIRTRTGIAQRYVADSEIATSDLAVEAGAAALKSADSASVGAVVVATSTPDYSLPATAPLVAARLDLGTVPAFDVGAVCSGFVYALASGAGMIAAGIAETVLVIGAEIMSRIVDPSDRGTAVLFGDGAGAVVLSAGEAGEPGAVGPFDLGSDGARADLLIVPAGGSRRRVDNQVLDERADCLTMDGREVYRQAVRRMVESSRVVLARAGLDVAEVDRFVGHQANARILDAVAKRLGITEERRVSNVERYGNTSAASIPLALADAGLQPGETVLLTAFGAGMSWGSTVLVWPDITPL